MKTNLQSNVSPATVSLAAAALALSIAFLPVASQAQLLGGQAGGTVNGTLGGAVNGAANGTVSGGVSTDGLTTTTQDTLTTAKGDARIIAGQTQQVLKDAKGTATVDGTIDTAANGSVSPSGAAVDAQGNASLGATANPGAVTSTAATGVQMAKHDSKRLARQAKHTAKTVTTTNVEAKASASASSDGQIK